MSSARTSPCGSTTGASPGSPTPSKKVENHAHLVALFAMHNNFVRVHRTLRMTPALAAGVSKRLWEIGGIVALVDAAEAKPAKSDPYKR
jgi:hypothetical protein